MAINLNGTGSISGLSSISAPAISGVPVGSASAPAFSFTGDSNTGIYSPGADQVAISTSGTGRLFVDSSGNVEISGTGKRIRGDFSNATHANRLSIQSSVTDGATSPFIIPNGTSTAAQVVVSNASDPTNSAFLSLGIFGGAINEARLNSSLLGSGTTLPLTFHVGGERLRITTDGKVGLGTSTPESTFHVNGYITVGYPTQNQTSSNLIQVLSQSDPADKNKAAINLGTTAGASSSNSFIDFYTNNYGVDRAIRMRIDSQGRVGVGTTSPAALLDVNDAIHCRGGIQVKTTTGDVNIEIGSGTTGNHNSYIDLIGDATYTDFGLRIIRYNTGPNAASQIVHRGTNSLYLEAIDAGSVVLKTNGTDRIIAQNDGSIVAPGFYNFTTVTAANVNIAADYVVRRSTSSAKYKTNIETLEDSYADAILGCRPVWYKSICEADNPDYGHWGFIAEEVEQIDPRLCHYGKDENGNQVVESVQYDRFVPHLLNLIKRQQQAIETLEAKVAALETP